MATIASDGEEVGGVGRGGFHPNTPYFESLLAQIRDGGPDALAAKQALIAHIRGRVDTLYYQILRKKYPDARRGMTEKITDASHDKFAEAITEKLETPFPSTGAMFKYLRAIIRTTTLDEIVRRAGPKSQTEEPPNGLPPDDILALEADSGPGMPRIMWEHVEYLPEADRELLDARYVGDSPSFEQIAFELGTKPSEVDARLAEIKGKLWRLVRETVEVMLGRLPGPEQALYNARHKEKKSIEKIAAAFGIEAGDVKPRLEAIYARLVGIYEANRAGEGAGSR